MSSGRRVSTRGWPPSCCGRRGGGHLYGGASAGRAVQGDPAVEGFDAVLEPDETGAASDVRAAAPVIPDADVQHAITGLDIDVDDGALGVLGGVGQRLGHHVVGG